MRVFIAIELPTEVKVALTALQNDLRQARAAVAWSRPDNLHLTINFIGEVEADQLPIITNACIDAAASVPPFSLQLNDTGVFPNVRQPKVLWVGLTGEMDKLQSLHRILEDNLYAAGFAKETRAYHPHLTLGRVGNPQNLEAVTAKLLMAELPALSFSVSSLVVMHSHVQSAVLTYTPLAKYQLKKG
jgi:RNA 2',3'-cyclic 3'-phosphodiesterase